MSTKGQGASALHAVTRAGDDLHARPAAPAAHSDIVADGVARAGTASGAAPPATPPPDAVVDGVARAGTASGAVPPARPDAVVDGVARAGTASGAAPPAPTPPDAVANTPSVPDTSPDPSEPATPSCEQRTAALQSAPVVLVSACLLGEACRYDGRSQRSERVLAALADKDIVPICPEVASGLPVPRPPVDLRGGTGVDVWAGRATAVERAGGVDRTEAFQRGACLALDAARRFGATVALLKEKSPSCGSQRVYESGQLRAGEGITTALLREHGVTVLSDEDL